MTISIDEDIQRARREGVADAGNLPFLLKPKGAVKAAVLLVHGFTASPWEMRLAGEALARNGYLALGVRLPGHGTTAGDLVQRPYEEWLSEVENGYRLLAANQQRVYGVGMSTGALLLLALAHSHQIHGLVLLSPYLRLRHWLAPAAGLLRFFKRYQKRPLPAELAAHYYAQRPVNGVYQLYRLIRRVSGLLPEITAPTFVISARGDQTVCVESAYRLYRQLGSSRKEHHMLGPEVHHILTTWENPRLKETLGMTLDFIEALERQ